MTAAEITDPEHHSLLDEALDERQGSVRLSGESIDIFVDEEWCVAGGAPEMAALLSLEEESIAGSPIGRLMHPDDVVVSPARIWRSGQATVIKFRQGDDYVRLAVKIRRAADGWLLNLAGVEAEVVMFPGVNVAEL